MKILLTNQKLTDFAGTETYLFTLAMQLKRLGHEPVVYSPLLGAAALKLSEAGIRTVDDPSQFVGEPFDVMHVHHNSMAVQCRAHLPNVPMVFVSHGVLPVEEQPPSLDLNISRYIAVSEEVSEHLVSGGVDKNQTTIVRNFVDVAHFCPLRPISAHPSRALIISNRITSKARNIIRMTCENLGIELAEIGIGAIPIWETELEINKADIVFALGRGAVEALACGRVVCIFDYSGGDGVLTPEILPQSQRFNFSGRYLNQTFTPDTLQVELKKYSQDLGDMGRAWVLQNHNAEQAVPRLLEIYQDAIDGYTPRPVMLPNSEINYLVGEVRRVWKEARRATESANALQQSRTSENLEHGTYVDSLKNVLNAREVEVQHLQAQLALLTETSQVERANFQTERASILAQLQTSTAYAQSLQDARNALQTQWTADRAALQASLAEAVRYSESLEQVLSQKDQYAANLEAQLRQQPEAFAQELTALRADLLAAQEYAASLESARLSSETYAQSLQEALQTAEDSAQSLEAARRTAEAYAHSLEDARRTAEDYARSLETAQRDAEKYIASLKIDHENQLVSTERDRANLLAELSRATALARSKRHALDVLLGFG